MITKAAGAEPEVGVARDSTPHVLTAELLRDLYECSPLGIIVTDKELTITQCNPAFAAIVGRTVDDVIGRRWLDLVDPEQLAAAQEATARVSASDLVVSTVERRVRRPDSEIRHVRLTGHIVRGDDGLPLWSFGLVEDVTDALSAARQLNEVRQRLQLVLSYSPIAVFSLDKDGIVTMTEGKALVALGLQPTDLVGHNIYDIVGTDPALVAPITRVLQGQPQHVIAEFAGRRYLGSLTPTFDDEGELNGVVGVGTDLTAFDAFTLSPPG
jgi:PAS domain S-box-containing protein